jgi:HlyD family secretion protein
MKKLLLLVVLLGAAGFGLAAWAGWIDVFGHETVTFRTKKVEKFDIHATVSATGTMEAEEVVDVGAQVPGMIIKLGPDPHDSTKSVDNCTQVKKDVLLAQIDDKIFKARVVQAEAAWLQAKATVIQTQARLSQYEREWRRAQQMSQASPPAISVSDYDLARANYETTRATLEMNKANVEACLGQLQEAQANLGYTTIRSPVDGVIIDRRVNVGQTVVASLNAPSLFLIARDLKRMEIWASVNEADIGQVRRGQEVSFTVAAFPGKDFHGKVTQIRLNASMNSSVVTYTVLVAYDNKDEKLLPYMTANLQFEVAQKKGVLSLPNPVFRWRPQPKLLAKEYRAEWVPQLKRQAQSETDKAPLKAASKDGQNWVTVWVQAGPGQVKPQAVRIGLTDGLNTEILEGLNEGDEVVWGVERTAKGGEGLFLKGVGAPKGGSGGP